MKHIYNILIQKYIDGELTEKEIQTIESHLADCASCRLKVDEQRAFSEKVKHSLENLVPDEIEIPSFSIKEETVSKDRAVHIAIISSLATLARWHFCLSSSISSNRVPSRSSRFTTIT